MAEHEHVLPPARYEHQDVTFRFMALGFVGTLAVLLLSALGLMWLYPSTTVDRRIVRPLPDYPAPRLQSDPAADLQQFLREELGQLNGSGWVDRAHGIVHIPIDAAMRRIVQQGIPDWPSDKEQQR